MSLPTTSSVYSPVGADPPPGHKVFFWNIGLASISLFWNHPQQFGPEPKKLESFQAPVNDHQLILSWVKHLQTMCGHLFFMDSVLWAYGTPMEHKGKLVPFFFLSLWFIFSRDWKTLDNESIKNLHINRIWTIKYYGNQPFCWVDSLLWASTKILFNQEWPVNKSESSHTKSIFMS